MSRKNPFEVRHPFFLPLWRRVLVTGVTVVWTVVELVFGSAIWGLLVGACAVYFLRQFFFEFDPAEYQERRD